MSVNKTEPLSDYEEILAQIKKKHNERVDAYPFNAESFLAWAREQYKGLTPRDHNLIAGAIYRWFYNGGMSK